MTDTAVDPMGPYDPTTGLYQGHSKLTDAQRCTAKKRGSDNQRCGQPHEPGTNVCRYHGGLAPQTKRRAALRLLELVDPAISTLAREMVQATSSGDRQRAANSILDRAGVPRVTTTPDSDAAKTLLMERLLALRAERESAEAEAVEVAVVESSTERTP